MSLGARAAPGGVGNDLGGQFSDAEEDEGSESAFDAEDESGVLAELQLDFPSLAAASTVPYCDDDAETGGQDPSERLRRRREAEEVRKQQSLRPVSKSGKLYNSFRKYGDLMKPRPSPSAGFPEAGPVSSAPEAVESAPTLQWLEAQEEKNQSRIMGGMAVAGQEADVEDDGEGWITSTAEIRTKKASGSLDPSKPGSFSSANSRAAIGPPAAERAACATTDFAMQNVILQMNLELLSVDGVRVRKLKSFVTRCGACYKVYTSSEGTGPLGKRLFCDKCGSDMLQRIAASVDGRTGRIRLHLSKRYKHNLRGTKFSLPKPGAGDRFRGDLLLREDQLLMGAWNQKVKMASGGKSRSSAQSMFGKDLASNMGCNAKAVEDDIRVGFGRRNPNASKGRERRGKRKKTSDKACGLRRY
jgi:RNA-binding protein NOB1